MTEKNAPDAPTNLINWRKDGGNRVTSGEGSLNLTLSDPIQPTDEGIYEIYYDTERSTGRGALYRVIVRGNRKCQFMTAYVLPCVEVCMVW